MEKPLLDPDIPLITQTPVGWAELVLRDPLSLLNDHAYLEKKSAMNALWNSTWPPLLIAGGTHGLYCDQNSVLGKFF